MFVYVLGPIDGPQKIGISSAPQVRCQAAQGLSPVKVECWHSVKVPTDQARTVELYAHALLAENRVRREWFDVSIEDAIVAVNRAAAEVCAGAEVSDIVEKPKTVLIATHLSRDVGKQLRQIAAEEGTTVKALLIDALNMLFKEEGKPQIASDPRF